jgi:hypothetical protein
MFKSVCPFCVWAAAGLLLAISAPDLLGARTPAGPALLWLVAIPALSAIFLRLRNLTN